MLKQPGASGGGGDGPVPVLVSLYSHLCLLVRCYVTPVYSIPPFPARASSVCISGGAPGSCSAQLPLPTPLVNRLHPTWPIRISCWDLAVMSFLAKLTVLVSFCSSAHFLKFLAVHDDLQVKKPRCDVDFVSGAVPVSHVLSAPMSRRQCVLQLSISEKCVLSDIQACVSAASLRELYDEI